MAPCWLVADLGLEGCSRDWARESRRRSGCEKLTNHRQLLAVPKSIIVVYLLCEPGKNVGVREVEWGEVEELELENLICRAPQHLRRPARAGLCTYFSDVQSSSILVNSINLCFDML